MNLGFIKNQDLGPYPPWSSSSQALLCNGITWKSFSKYQRLDLAPRGSGLIGLRSGLGLRRFMDSTGDSNLQPGTSLAVQWLRLCTSISGGAGSSLVRELRSHMPCSAAKKTQKQKPDNLQPELPTPTLDGCVMSLVGNEELAHSRGRQLCRGGDSLCSIVDAVSSLAFSIPDFFLFAKEDSETRKSQCDTALAYLFCD